MGFEPVAKELPKLLRRRVVVQCTCTCMYTQVRGRVGFYRFTVKDASFFFVSLSRVSE